MRFWKLKYARILCTRGYWPCRPRNAGGGATPRWSLAVLSRRVGGLFCVRFRRFFACFTPCSCRLRRTSSTTWCDFEQGNDRDGRLGPRRACAQGWISPRRMKIGIVVDLRARCAPTPLVWYGGWNMAVVALVGAWRAPTCIPPGRIRLRRTAGATCSWSCTSA